MKNRYGFLEEKALPWMIDEDELEKSKETKRQAKLDKINKKKIEKEKKKGNGPVVKPPSRIKEIAEKAKSDLLELK